MALVNIINVCVLDNPTMFTNPFQFEVTVECLQDLPDDIDWKIVYVGSAEDSTHDQTLEEVSVGPVTSGVSKFVLQAPAPDPATIANADLIGVTVVLVTCSYNEQEFTRIGYYVNNEYTEPYEEGSLPDPVELSKLRRNILAAEPRVTRFPINWSGEQPGVLAQEALTETFTAEDDDALDLDEMEEGGEEDEEDEEDDDEDDDDIDLAEEDESAGADPADPSHKGTILGQGNGLENVQNVGTDQTAGMGLGNEAALAVGEVMLMEDSNSMDVARMQRAPLF